jgi:glycerol kinase
MQIQSNLLNCPVIRPLETESTALGAALLAGLGIGVWQSTHELKNLAEMDDTFTPKDGSYAVLRNQWKKGIQASKGWAHQESYE